MIHRENSTFLKVKMRAISQNDAAMPIFFATSAASVRAS